MPMRSLLRAATNCLILSRATSSRFCGWKSCASIELEMSNAITMLIPSLVTSSACAPARGRASATMPTRARGCAAARACARCPRPARGPRASTAHAREYDRRRRARRASSHHDRQQQQEQQPQRRRELMAPSVDHAAASCCFAGCGAAARACSLAHDRVRLARRARARARRVTGARGELHQIDLVEQAAQPIERHRRRRRASRRAARALVSASDATGDARREIPPQRHRS